MDSVPVPFTSSSLSQQGLAFIERIRALPLFAGVEYEHMIVIAEKARFDTISQEAPLHRKQDSQGQFIVITAGWAGNVNYSPSNKRAIMQLCGPGDFLPNLESVQSPWEALTFIDLIRIPLSTIALVSERSPNLRENIATLQAQYDRDLRNNSILVRQESLQRVANFLLWYSLKTNQTKNILVPLNQTQIGDYIGLTREAVNHGIGDLKQKGLAAMQGLKIIIPDIDPVWRFCDFTSFRAARAIYMGTVGAKTTLGNLFHTDRVGNTQALSGTSNLPRIGFSGAASHEPQTGEMPSGTSLILEDQTIIPDEDIKGPTTSRDDTLDLADKSASSTPSSVASQDNLPDSIVLGSILSLKGHLDAFATAIENGRMFSWPVDGPKIGDPQGGQTLTTFQIVAIELAKLPPASVDLLLALVNAAHEIRSSRALIPSKTGNDSNHRQTLNAARPEEGKILIALDQVLVETLSTVEKPEPLELAGAAEEADLVEDRELVTAETEGTPVDGLRAEEGSVATNDEHTASLTDTTFFRDKEGRIILPRYEPIRITSKNDLIELKDCSLFRDDANLLLFERLTDDFKLRYVGDLRAELIATGRPQAYIDSNLGKLLGGEIVTSISGKYQFTRMAQDVAKLIDLEPEEAFLREATFILESQGLGTNRKTSDAGTVSQAGNVVDIEDTSPIIAEPSETKIASAVQAAFAAVAIRAANKEGVSGNDQTSPVIEPKKDKPEQSDRADNDAPEEIRLVEPLHTETDIAEPPTGTISIHPEIGQPIGVPANVLSSILVASRDATHRSEDTTDPFPSDHLLTQSPFAWSCLRVLLHRLGLEKTMGELESDVRTVLDGNMPISQIDTQIKLIKRVFAFGTDVHKGGAKLIIRRLSQQYNVMPIAKTLAMIAGISTEHPSWIQNTFGQIPELGGGIIWAARPIVETAPILEVGSVAPLNGNADATAENEMDISGHGEATDNNSQDSGAISDEPPAREVLEPGPAFARLIKEYALKFFRVDDFQTRGDFELALRTHHLFKRSEERDANTINIVIERCGDLFDGASPICKYGKDDSAINVTREAMTLISLLRIQSCDIVRHIPQLENEFLLTQGMQDRLKDTKIRELGQSNYVAQLWAAMRRTGIFCFSALDAYRQEHKMAAYKDWQKHHIFYVLNSPEPDAVMVMQPDLRNSLFNSFDRVKYHEWRTPSEMAPSMQ